MRALLIAWCCFALSPTVLAGPADPTSIEVTVHQDGETIVIDCQMHIDVSQEEAWAVLTDFEHMAAFVANLKESRVLERHGEHLKVQQKGVARHGPFSFSFESLREITLKPISEIHSRAFGGDVQQMEGVTQLSREGAGTHITFHSVSIPGMRVPPVVGPAFIKGEVTEQFQNLLDEMQRRKPQPSAKSLFLQSLEKYA